MFLILPAILRSEATCLNESYALKAGTQALIRNLTLMNFNSNSGQRDV